MYSFYFITLQRSGTRTVTKPLRSIRPEHRGTFHTQFWLTAKCASRHSDVQFFISHLARWLRTRRCSEPTFQPGATNHWKNTVFSDFPTFSRVCIFFLWLFLFSDLLSSLLFSLTLPISAFHLSILSEVSLLNFLRIYINVDTCVCMYIYIYISLCVWLRFFVHLHLDAPVTGNHQPQITFNLMRQLDLHAPHCFKFALLANFDFLLRAAHTSPAQGVRCANAPRQNIDSACFWQLMTARSGWSALMRR